MKRRPEAGDDRLISGKLRGKSARKGAANVTLDVDGTEYVWAHRHGFTVWGKGLKVASVSVWLRPGRTRELILDLTLAVDDEIGAPSEERFKGAVAEGVRAAVEAGWDPESRGRAFRYEMEEPIRP